MHSINIHSITKEFSNIVVICMEEGSESVHVVETDHLIKTHDRELQGQEEVGCMR